MRTRVSRHCVILAAAMAATMTPTTSAEVRRATGANALKQQLERLRVVGSVLMIAAHPDDENTALLAYCAQGRKLRTAYLSLTRGEGGQNLIGSEQGDLLGVIRTQELLAARKVDGAEQFFTRAVDFGFSKTADETLRKWGRDQVLADVVWVIRLYRPDVIFLRFSGTTRDGHGHHQSSSILGQEAFKLAADPKAFPEQLKHVAPWQAKRILWNGFSFNRQQEQELDKMPERLMVDTGEYDHVLGSSYGELAGLSRSQHRSQGMGSPERKGSAPNYLFHYGGEPARSDFMDGVGVSWSRLAGGAAVQKLLDQAAAGYDLDAPEKVIPWLMQARKLIAAINHPDAQRKLKELDEAVVMAAGLWLEVNASQAEAAPGSRVTLNLTAVNRGHAAVELTGVQLQQAGRLPGAALAYNKPHTAQLQWTVSDDQPLTQPIQLREPRSGDLYATPSQTDIGRAEADPVLTAHFLLQVDGAPVEISRAVEHRYVDRVRGELTRPFVIVPPVAVRMPQTALLFASPRSRTLPVEIVANAAAVEGTVTLRTPPGWNVEPPAHAFKLDEAGKQAVLAFQVTPPAAGARGELAAVAKVGAHEVPSGIVRLSYEHIPPQTVLVPARTKVLREDVKTSARRVGYIMGAGDEVPAALRELGCEVTLLEAADLARGDLSPYDAIVTGVRAWNVRDDLRAAHPRLRQYMENGGTLVVQYNTLDGMFGGGDSPALRNIGPFPIRIGRDRTTVEEAEVTLLKPDHRLFQSPNRVTPADFAGWVQERALYFPSQWDDRYEALLECHDPGEAPQKGGLLYARVGKGAYVFSSYVWFRELPAGVPGAYRLFANIVSAGK
ncbi:MAG: PIG-L family deacetylase [Candidatus Solibacter usitatus]|nr:PIG-L family deacetylase [Candidatus Solibacter usitatus]